MAASLGGVEAVGNVLAGLPGDFPVPIAVVQHRTKHFPNYLARVLQRRTSLTVKDAEAGEKMVPGCVYVAPSDLHLVVDAHHRLQFSDGQRIRYVLSSANPLLVSAAEHLGGDVLAAVLTGGGQDATDGVQSVYQAGGVVIAQDMKSSESFSMPKSAIATGSVSLGLPLHEIAPTIMQLLI
nr:chemotaxis protein CheB [Lacipirellula parvula]